MCCMYIFIQHKNYIVVLTCKKNPSTSHFGIRAQTCSHCEIANVSLREWASIIGIFSIIDEKQSERNYRRQNHRVKAEESRDRAWISGRSIAPSAPRASNGQGVTTRVICLRNFTGSARGSSYSRSASPPLPLPRHGFARFICTNARGGPASLRLQKSA